MLYPDAGVMDPGYYGYGVMQKEKPAFWDGKSLNLPPVFGWGSAIGAAPVNIQYPGWLNINRTRDFATSVTKIAGRHTLQGRWLPQSQLQGAERRRRRYRQPELPGIRELRQRHNQCAR